MTVDDIRRLSPEQMNRIAAIRGEIETLELEMDQIIKGEKPRSPSKPKAKKQPASKPKAKGNRAKSRVPSARQAAPAANPLTPAAPASPVGGVLSRLALPKFGNPSSADLDN